MFNALPVFEFLRRAAHQGPVALVTITGLEGASTRDPGTHMGVASDGRWFGSLSGGCIEAAVAREALAAIAEGKPRTLRLGKGSPFIDIRLPCGGGIDLAIHPLAHGKLAEAVCERLRARGPASLLLPHNAEAMLLPQRTPRGFERVDAGHCVTHSPPLRIVIAGQGAAAAALYAQAEAFGAIVELLTPDEALASALEGQGAAVTRLKTIGEPHPALQLDCWSAAVFYFHDHEWEVPLLEQALAQPHFYLGAMGSFATHQARCAGLAERGVSTEAINAIRAPIGLMPASRDPEVLALSTLAEIVEAYGRAG